MPIPVPARRPVPPTATRTAVHPSARPTVHPPVRPADRPASVPLPRRAPEETRSAGVSGRDRAILMAVAAGRCTISPEPAGGLLVDGHPVADQFAGQRLVGVGLVRAIAQPPGRPSTLELTPAGIALTGLPIMA